MPRPSMAQSLTTVPSLKHTVQPERDFRIAFSSSVRLA